MTAPIRWPRVPGAEFYVNDASVGSVGRRGQILTARKIERGFDIGKTRLAHLMQRPWRHIERRKSRQIMVGDWPLGGCADCRAIHDQYADR